MKFSIITITYNSASTVEQTLLSVIGQDYKNIEYIVVDGGSTDNTLQIIEKHREKIHKVITGRDKGLYDALNKGIAAASGEVIGFLHSDDLYMSHNVLSKYAETFLDTGTDAVYSDLYYVNRSNTNTIIRKWKSGDYSENSFLNGWMPPHPTFYAKKEMYLKYGGFNLDFKSAADYELMLRFIYKNKIRIAYLPEYTIRMRVGGKSNVTVSNRLKANLEDRKAWKINGLRPKFYTLYLKPLRKILQFF